MPLYTRTLLIVGPPEEAELASARHREQLREMHERGQLRSAGEFANGDGFLEIFEAADLHEAQALTAASPLVSEGLGTWMLREWTEIKF